MKKLTAKELRNKWIEFYKSKGHVDIGAVSLIGDGTTGVMFNVAGMQPLMPYLLGQKHPKGTRLCNVQGCVRTVDIDEVGDESHFTFFEMMGNWSLGDYFKKEKTAWTLELLTKEFGLDVKEICSTVFAGNSQIERDDETANLLLDLGISKDHIFYIEDNLWQLEGTVNTPCGPDNEWFYPLHDKSCGENCGPNCNCGRYVEIGNDVYMQYKKTESGFEPLKSKNVDTGFGFERLLMFLNGFSDGYKTDLFSGAIKEIEKLSGKTYGTNVEDTKSMRIIADHIRTSVMLIGDEQHLVPSNIGAGYILRRLIRRAVRHARKIGIDSNLLVNVANIFIDDVYSEAYPLLVKEKGFIINELLKEIDKFEKTLEQGIKEFEKVASFCKDGKMSGKTAFRLYDTFGFPFELTKELAQEKNLSIDENEYLEAYKIHQEKSKANNDKVFKGGLADTGIQTTRLHTAVHLLQAGLRKIVSSDIYQKGSNITSERLRFDFNCDHKLSDEEKQKLEDFVNDAIKRDIPVVCEEMSLDEAKKQGALGVFEHKYGDKVKVYTIGDVSKEICGGPHANRTSELKHFKIVKEESSSAGVRRIKAVIEN